MINHTRTLLLNISAGSASLEDDLTGEEFIDPAFVPKILPNQLKGLYVTFVPEVSTRTRKNYLGFVYMQLLHAPEFEADTLAPDPRFTYKLSEDEFFEIGLAESAPLDLASVHERSRVEVMQLQNQQFDLFSIKGPREDEMAELKNVWNATTSMFDRVAATVLALTYHLDTL